MSVVVSPKIASTPLHHDIGTLQGTMPLRQAEVETTVHPERVCTRPPNRAQGTPKTILWKQEPRTIVISRNNIPASGNAENT